MICQTDEVYRKLREGSSETEININYIYSMYVTRPLSLYLNDELALTLPPPEHNSGYLVISDAESEILLRLRGGNHRMRRLPFFQNKDFIVDSYSDSENHNKVLFIPVLNSPLSDNRYYVMSRDGWERNLAATSLREDELDTGCGGCCMPQDAPSRPLNPFNSYQQFEIIQKPRDRFQAKSMAPDGVPPLFLREPWKPYIAINTHRHPLQEALGLNSSLRAQLPHFNFSSSHDHSEPVIVGKWYCPFMFVRDKGKKTTFYEMTLEQKWVRFFSKENDNSTGEKGVHVEVDVQTRVAKIAGKNDVVREGRDVASGFLHFIGYDRHRREEVVGLSNVIMERMKWEEESVGWVGGTNGNEKVVRVEEFEGSGTWRKFSCYLLVESFVLKRKDNSFVISFDFHHTHQVRCKWE